VIILLVSTFAALDAAAQQARIFLTFPAGGENLVVDSTYYIRWFAQNVTGTLRVEYSADSGATWKLIDTVSARAGGDSLAWRIPDDTTHRAFARVRTVDSTVRGRSQRTFSIVRVPVPVLRVLAPNGGELFAVDSVATVRWSAEYVTGQLAIEYSVDSGSTWKSITTVDAHDGTDSIAWRIPNDTTSKGFVRVRASDGSASDASNRTFLIRGSINPTITIVAPNGGEVFRVDSNARIRWMGADLSGQIAMEYSVDSGATWKQIGLPRAARNGADSSTWRIPNDTTRRALVRIRQTSGPASDVSDRVFTIEGSPAPPQPSIALLYPNGGVFHADSVIVIRWNSANIVGGVVVEYSRDSLRTWQRIVAVPSSTSRDSVQWTIPNDSTDEAFVRVRSGDSAVQARSLAPLTILPRPVSGIDDALTFASAALAVAPNPVLDVVAIHWSQPRAGEARVRVTDLRGALVLDAPLGERMGGAQSATIDLGNLASGAYRCAIVAGGCVASSMLVVAR
jgi:hypothetical protein